MRLINTPQFIWFIQKASPLLLALLLFFGANIIVSAEYFDCNAGKHDFSVTIIDATESKDGKKIYSCSICNYSFVQVLPAIGHKWSNWIVDIQPTCLEEGRKYRICTTYSNDPHKEVVEIEALGHSYVEEVIPATCEKAGYITYTCKRCGDNYDTKNGDATGHNYKLVNQTEPTCGSKGEKEYQCEDCGDTYNEKIDSLNEHQFEESILKESTCNQEGEKRFDCQICGKSYTESIEKNINHDYELSEFIKATCETKGTKILKCKICGDEVFEEFSPINHDYGDWIIDKIATTEEEGHRYRICSHDSNHIIEEAIDKKSEGINAFDIILCSLSGLSLASFSIAIYSDYRVLKWEKRKRKSFKQWYNDYTSE